MIITKKITSILLCNFRAYHSKYDPIRLENGENLLIYGENGSGKSSLFKAINNYLSSSTDTTIPFIKNRYNPIEDGEINITFNEFNENFEKVIGQSLQYKFGSSGSNNDVPFIQDAALIKGFLDYTDLLNVYYHKEEKPNLFNLIVLSLLGEHIPISSGGNFRFKEKWKQLQEDLIDNAYTRTTRIHKQALSELPIFQTHLEKTLSGIFIELNRMLDLYFNDLKIELKYKLQDLTFNYGQTWEWHTTSDLRLQVIKDSVLVPGDYRDLLNEASLSAFAICLYLASLKLNPTLVDFKILYLDDVFVGLDTSNRIPILNILENEFRDYQIVISTYDRHWFELAKRHFGIHNPNRWTNLEIYVGKDIKNNIEFSTPILVKGGTNYEKAVQYLHNRSKPDYPAAANYFRKSLEELIQLYIPKWEIADSENTQILDHQLTSLAYKTKSFIEKTGNDSVEITAIIGLLHSLLHPLSHHEITSPVYKGELIIIESNFSKLSKRLQLMDIPNNYKCCLEPNKRLKMTIEIDTAANSFSYYEFILKEPLTLIKNGAGIPIIGTCHCVVDKCYGILRGTSTQAFNPDKKNPNFNYTSLSLAYEGVYNFLINSSIGVFPKSPNYLNSIEYHDGSNWKPLSDLIVW